MIAILLAALGDNEPEITRKQVSSNDCGTTSGICQACIDYNISTPYWYYSSSYKQCVSCQEVDTSAVYFDQYNKKCVSQCPDATPATVLGPKS